MNRIEWEWIGIRIEFVMKKELDWNRIEFGLRLNEIWNRIGKMNRIGYELNMNVN